MPNFQALDKCNELLVLQFAELHGLDMWALPGIFRFLRIPKKVPT